MKSTTNQWIGIVGCITLFMNSAFSQHAPQDNWILESGKSWKTENIGSSFGVAIGDGKLFVSDYGTEKGVYVYDQNDGHEIMTIGKDELAEPLGLAFHNGKLFVVDNTAPIINIYTLDGNLVTNWGSRGTADGQINTPRHIAVDDNHIYVTDDLGHQIHVFTHDGVFVRNLGEVGTLPGQFVSPNGVAVDQQHVYVADNTTPRRIQVFDKEGNFVKFWTVHTNLQVKDTQHFVLQSIAVDNNNVYVTGHFMDYYYSRVNNNKLWIYDKLGNELDNFYWFDSATYHVDVPYGVAVSNPFTYVTTGRRGYIRAIRRVGRTLGELPLNAPPLGSITYMNQREGTRIMDIDYFVSDPDNSNLTVHAAAFVTTSNAEPSLDTMLPLRSFIEGTEANIGSNISTGMIRRMTWDMNADMVDNLIIDYGNLKVYLLARDDRDLLDLHLLHLPAVGTNAAVVINRAPLFDEDLLPVWYWWLAEGDTNISLSGGTIYGESGAYSGQALAFGTNTTALGREYLFSQLGYREATPFELQFAREATDPGNIIKHAVRQEPPFDNYMVNEFNFVTEPTNGWWVVPLP